MVSFRGQKNASATPKSVPFRGLIQNFRRASPLLSYAKSLPPAIWDNKGVWSLLKTKVTTRLRVEQAIQHRRLWGCSWLANYQLWRRWRERWGGKASVLRRYKNEIPLQSTAIVSAKTTYKTGNCITALITNMRTLKFKSRLHNCVFRCRQS